MANKHNLNIDVICDLLMQGLTLITIAKELNVPQTTLYDFLYKKPEHIQKTQLALRVSADAYVHKAIECLEALHKGSTIAEIAKAKSLAVHYRWLAGKRNPAVYNDRLAALLQQGEVKSKRKTIVVELQQDDDPVVKSNVKSLPPETVPYIEVPKSLNAENIIKENESETQEFKGANDD